MTLQEIEQQLNILEEDNHIIVVVKPRNMPSQADNTGDLDLRSLIKDYLKQKYNKQGNVYCALVHRLDRPTGGVMMFAKTEKAASRLSEQLREGSVDKKYLAVVSGYPIDKVARLEHYLVKDTKDNVVKAYNAKVDNSKHAILNYKVLEQDEGISLVDINLITGRSHQIRAQMSKVGHALYGDHKYSPSGKIAGYGKPLSLWAYSLTFTHPIKGDTRVFKVFPPTGEIPWSIFNVEKYIPVAKPD